MLARKARAILGEEPETESAQLPSDHPIIRPSGSNGRMTRCPDDPMTIGRSLQEGIEHRNARAFRRTGSTTARRGFMLARKALAILDKVPATESAQLPSDHPTIRSGLFLSQDDPMIRYPDGRMPRWHDDPMTIGIRFKKASKETMPAPSGEQRTQRRDAASPRISQQILSPGGKMEKLEYREMMIQRTVMFTVNLDKMLRNLPSCMAKKKLQDQLGRSGSSIGANFAESGPAESRKDFIHKLSIALKEAEETSFWLRCVIAEFPENKDAEELWNECHEFIKILQASVSTARANGNLLDTGTK